MLANYCGQLTRHREFHIPPCVLCPSLLPPPSLLLTLSQFDVSRIPCHSLACMRGTALTQYTSRSRLLHIRRISLSSAVTYLVETPEDGFSHCLPHLAKKLTTTNLTVAQAPPRSTTYLKIATRREQTAEARQGAGEQVRRCAVGTFYFADCPRGHVHGREQRIGRNISILCSFRKI